MRYSLLIMLSFILSANVMALDVNKKFGKPTDEEMSMTIYAPDPDADAVKLYSDTDVQFEFMTDDFWVVYRVKERIKVLKPEGASAADVTIVFYDPQGTSNGDRISGVKGSAYNLEEGKVVRSKLTGDVPRLSEFQPAQSRHRAGTFAGRYALGGMYQCACALRLQTVQLGRS